MIVIFSSNTIDVIDNIEYSSLIIWIKDFWKKFFSIKVIGFVYNIVFVILFKTKKNYNILYCQIATICLPASYKLV